jgi:hypothetical protein
VQCSRLEVLLRVVRVGSGRKKNFQVKHSTHIHRICCNCKNTHMVFQPCTIHDGTHRIYNQVLTWAFAVEMVLKMIALGVGELALARTYEAMCECHHTHTHTQLTNHTTNHTTITHNHHHQKQQHPNSCIQASTSVMPGISLTASRSSSPSSAHSQRTAGLCKACGHCGHCAPCDHYDC